jgi:glycosyltransferase involved in cell wall biosynthesis
LLAGVPRWLAHKRTVVTVHGLDWQREKWGAFARGVLKLGETASYRLPDRTIVVSRVLQDYYRERRGVATTYIPNGITPPAVRDLAPLRAHGVPDDFVLFAARLVPEKGLHVLLEAHRRLPAAIRAAYPLIVAGDAGFTPGYAQKLRADAHAEVRFLGFVHGELLEALFCHAAVMVLPSSLEGLSISLLEAMACGRCCLVSDIPPNLEAAAGHAAVFPVGDAAALSARLLALLAEPAARQRLGEAAREHAMRTYAWDQVTARTAAVYRELVARAG